MGFTRSFRLASMIPGVLSCIASFVILGTHYCLMPRKSQARSNKKLIAYLQMAILGSDLIALIFSHPGDSCEVYSVFTAFFLLSGAIWGSIVARQLQLLVVNRQSLNRALYRLHSYAEEDRPFFNLKGFSLEKVRMSVFHLLAWGLPLLFSGVIAVISVTREPITVWCWFNQPDDDTLYVPRSASPQMLLFYIPISLSLLYNGSVLGGAVLKYLTRVCGDEDEPITDPLEQEISKLARNLRWFVLLSTIISFWLCIAEMVNVTKGSTSRLGVFLVLVVLLRLHGIASLVVYANDKSVKKCWQLAFTRGRNWVNGIEEEDEEGEGGEEELDGRQEVEYDENPLSYVPPKTALGANA